MARGASKAQSEAGTVRRAETQGRRIKDALETLASGRAGGSGTVDADVRDILTKPRGNDERYEISLGTLEKGGKLNLIDGTLDGKELSRETRGAFDKTNVVRRGSDDADADFNYEASKAQKQEGFVFAKNEKGDVFAIPHSWDVNDPQKTVGIFKGDRITYNDARGVGQEITVIGTFDNTKRGLNLASAAAGDALGRVGGIKQTATVLGNFSIGDRLTNQNRTQGQTNSYVYRDVIDRQVIADLNSGSDGLRSINERIKRLG